MSVLYIIRWPKAFCHRFNMVGGWAGVGWNGLALQIHGNVRSVVGSFAQKLLNLMQFN